MIDAYVIRIKGNALSERAALKLYNSIPTNVKLHEFDACLPKHVNNKMKNYNIKWNYPWVGEELDMASGLIKKAYPTADPKKRIACFLSHYMLWRRCIKMDKPIIIHEHDAIYYEDTPLPLEEFAKSRFDIIGLNNPRGATRLAGVYDNVMQEANEPIIRAPVIDIDMVPQGIAGNSSYYMEPTGAHRAISLVEQYGGWPNDALMCRQLIPSIGATKHYYTYVQGLQSTTSS